MSAGNAAVAVDPDFLDQLLLRPDHHPRAEEQHRQHQGNKPGKPGTMVGHELAREPEETQKYSTFSLEYGKTGIIR